MAAPRFRLFAEAPAPGDHYTCDAGGAGRPADGLARPRAAADLRRAGCGHMAERPGVARGPAGRRPPCRVAEAARPAARLWLAVGCGAARCSNSNGPAAVPRQRHTVLTCASGLTRRICLRRGCGRWALPKSNPKSGEQAHPVLFARPGGAGAGRAGAGACTPPSAARCAQAARRCGTRTPWRCRWARPTCASGCSTATTANRARWCTTRRPSRPTRPPSTGRTRPSPRARAGRPPAPQARVRVGFKPSPLQPRAPAGCDSRAVLAGAGRRVDALFEACGVSSPPRGACWHGGSACVSALCLADGPLTCPASLLPLLQRAQMLQSRRCAAAGGCACGLPPTPTRY